MNYRIEEIKDAGGKTNYFPQIQQGKEWKYLVTTGDGFSTNDTGRGFDDYEPARKVITDHHNTLYPQTHRESRYTYITL